MKAETPLLWARCSREEREPESSRQACSTGPLGARPRRLLSWFGPPLRMRTLRRPLGPGSFRIARRPTGSRTWLTEEGADAIVLGSTHRGPLGRVLVGSVAERLLTGAPCGIVVAPRGYGEGDPAGLPRVIAVGFDGSPESRRALAQASELAQACGAPFERSRFKSPRGCRSASTSKRTCGMRSASFRAACGRTVRCAQAERPRCWRTKPRKAWTCWSWLARLRTLPPNDAWWSLFGPRAVIALSRPGRAAVGES